MMQFDNQSQLEFVDISSEEHRTYRFNNNQVVHIQNPLRLNVSASGGHRIFDAEGNSHYISPGWLHLKWKAKPGQPHFVK